MINLTPNIILTSDFDPLKLDKMIRSAIQYAIEIESKQLGAENGKMIKYNKPISCYTFGHYFSQELNKKSLFGEEFLRAACKISQVHYLEKHETIPDLDSLLEITFQTNFHGKKIKGSRAGLRIMLMRLWQQGTVCLPLGFHLQQSIKNGNLQSLLTEVSGFFWNYDSKKILKPQNHPELGSWDDSDLSRRAYRLFLATDWHSFDQVNLGDLAKLHILFLKGAEWLSSTRHPVLPMLKEMMARRATELTFTITDLETYEKYFNGGYFNEYEFDYYHENFDQIRKIRRRIYGERRSVRHKKDLINRSGYELTDGDDLTLTPKELILSKIAQENTHEAAMKYFESLAAMNSNLYSVKPYPGRNHIDVKTLGSLWLEIFEDFIKRRQNNGSESSESVVSELKILKDYLFCYLPWWNELHPDNSIHLPTSPADFERSMFFRAKRVNITNAPLSFLELLNLRRKTVNSSGRAISVINALYNYIKGFFDEYPGLKDRTIKNPVVMEIDFPRGRGKGSKTNKPPFSKKIVPYLLRFLYAVEELGMHLQKLAFENKLNFGPYSQPENFILKEIGLELKIHFEDRVYVIEELPNVFAFIQRVIKTPDGETRKIFLPHLSALRVLIVMFETGLRGQSVQWLDKRLWDAGNKDKSSDTKVYELFVNTDKTREKPWIAPLIDRAREVLLREQRFQKSIVEENIDREIPYENREHSRFAGVVPLFRSAGYKGNPIGDGVYNKAWTEILRSFQEFYNSAVTKENPVQFVKLNPKYHGGIESPETLIRNVRTTTGGEKEDFYPTKYSAIHTPHAMRSTFISLRCGILNIEDIAASVGHTSIVTTYHYTVRPFGEIAEKIEEADCKIFKFDVSQQHQIRADKPDSQLQTSWRKDPQETEKKFGFMSVSLLNEKTENFEDGVEILRTTPASNVVFRETHICPVGETCPTNIIDLIHEPRRCGLCPLAVKSIDHAPAIAAKMRQLLEQMKAAADLLEKRKLRKEPEATIDEINERRKLDALEYTSWQKSLDILNEIINSKPSDKTGYIVDEPEIVKLHLRCVARESTSVDFILHRILDSKSYLVLETPALRAKANQLRQQLLVNSGRIKDALAMIPEGDEIEAFLSSMSAAMKTFDLTAEQLVARGMLDFNDSSTGEDTGAPRLLSAGQNMSFDIEAELVN